MLGGCLQPLFCILLAAIHSQRKKELKVEIRIFGCGFIFAGCSCKLFLMIHWTVLNQ
jgi:hypothetical protein